MMLAGTDSVPFDWCSFYSLFWNDKGIKCKINIPDTVLFRYGQLSAWWHTSKEGYIQRHTSQSTSIEAVRKRFLAVAQEDNANYSKFVCVSLLGSGKPQLLRVMAFNQLCELLSNRLESGQPDTAPEIETPEVLQAFVQPWQDLRYVTTYINSGVNVACHTFQRKYSRRYTPMSAATAAQLDSRDADIIMAVGPDADVQRAEIDNQQGSVEPSLKMQLRKLTAHIVKYIQRAHGLTLGGIVCEYIRDADGKVYLMSVLRTEWASNAHGHGAGSLYSAALQAPTKEMPDPDAASSHTQTSLTGRSSPHCSSGRNSGLRSRSPSPQNQSAVQPSCIDEVIDDNGSEDDEGEDEFDTFGDAHSPAGRGEQCRRSQGPMLIQQAPSNTTSPTRVRSAHTPQRHDGELPGSPASVLKRPMTARPCSQQSSQSSGTVVGRSALAEFPGGQGRSSNLAVSVSNTWPSLQHDAALSPKTPSSTIPSATTQPAITSISGVEASMRGPAGLPPTPITRPATAGYVRPSSSGPSGHKARSLSPGAAPGGAPLGFGSSTHRTTHVSPKRPYSARGVPGVAPSEFAPVPGGVQPPMVGALTAQGHHVNGGARGAPLMVMHLQHEIEQLRDQLLYQHDLAEASSAKVRQLERESAMVTATFDSRKNELEHLLSATRSELAKVTADRDTWQHRAVEAETRASAAETERATLSGQLSSERGTTLTALGEYQDRIESDKSRMKQLESEVERLSTALKMETTAVNSLKRQLLEFSEIAERNKATLRDADLDPALVDVMGRTGYLLAGQANPTGEQYALQKVLQHYHSDLRAVFLFYCQLENSFTDHWPPSMSFAQWMLFCRDSETSDPRAGARVRSNQHFKMLQPAACEELFAKFSRMDDHAVRLGGKQENVLTYESFLCCVLGCASALRRPEVPFLSEATREYVLRYLSKAKKVTPQGLGRGMLRSAVEGTRASPSLLADTLKFGPSSGNEVGSNQVMQYSSNAGSPETGQKKGKRTNSLRTPSARSLIPSAVNSGRSSPRPGAAVPNPARMLAEAGNSAVMKELALLSLSGPSSNREVVRTGGGFSVC